MTLHAWQNGGCKDPRLISLVKALFQLVTRLNVDLKVHYTRSSENHADAPSRKLSVGLLDSMLALNLWAWVGAIFGCLDAYTQVLVFPTSRCELPNLS